MPLAAAKGPATQANVCTGSTRCALRFALTNGRVIAVQSTHEPTWILKTSYSAVLYCARSVLMLMRPHLRLSPGQSRFYRWSRIARQGSSLDTCAFALTNVVRHTQDPVYSVSNMVALVQAYCSGWTWRANQPSFVRELDARARHIARTYRKHEVLFAWHSVRRVSDIASKTCCILSCAQMSVSPRCFACTAMESISDREYM